MAESCRIYVAEYSEELLGELALIAKEAGLVRLADLVAKARNEASDCIRAAARSFDKTHH